MMCFGRTKTFKRCGNRSKKWFCQHHRWQPYTFGFGLIGVIAMFAGLYQDLLKPVFVARQDSPPDEPRSSDLGPGVLPKVRTTLALRVEQAGVWDPFGGGRYFQFTLSNSEGGLAIVDAISVDVIDVIEEDYYMLPEALPNKYDYFLRLSPEDRGLKKFAEGFTYAQGDADRFGVLIASQLEGCDYFFRFRVDWYDDLTKEKHIIFSHVFFAKLPNTRPPLSAGVPEYDSQEYRELYYAQSRKIWTELAKLRKTFPHSPNAIHP